jgi:hypothetical protein
MSCENPGGGRPRLRFKNGQRFSSLVVVAEAEPVPEKMVDICAFIP